MARRRKRKPVNKDSSMLCCYSYSHLWLGVILLLVGYLFAQGWSWTSVLMAVGALLIFKGLYVTYQK